MRGVCVYMWILYASTAAEYIPIQKLVYEGKLWTPGNTSIPILLPGTYCQGSVESSDGATAERRHK